jgi:antitoxin Phd
MATWQLQDAKAKLSEVIETAQKHGPQIITRRGVATAVIVPIDQWQRLSERPSILARSEREKSESFLKLLQSGPQFDLPIPSRGRMRLRKPVRF